MKVDPARVIPDKRKSIRESAIKASGWYYAEGSISEMTYKALGKRYGFTLDTPVKDFSKEALHALLYGTGDERIEMQRESMFGSGTYFNQFEGIIPNLERRFRETSSEWVKEEIALVMSSEECPACHGRRLKPTSLAVTVGGINIADFCDKSVNEELDFITTAKVSTRDEMIGAPIFKEVKERLGFLKSVGLGYLTLSRGAASLSGGESQRIRLATQIGSALTGVLYVLDEPSIGLHPANVDGLLGVMRDLVADGNSVVVVDHDVRVLKVCDHLIEMGPVAGAEGGHVIAQGTVGDVAANPRSRIAPFLADGESVRERGCMPVSHMFDLGHIRMTTSQLHTVKPLDVDIPRGRLVAVTGVSGSGKTTMVLESLIPALKARSAGEKPPEHVRSIDADGIERANLIDATPIGANVRSTVATYADIHDDLRRAFARSDEAKAGGWKAGDFSYNTGRLRCPTCDGTGSISLDVQFLPDVDIECPDCRGSRYAPEADAIHRTTKDGRELTLPQLMAMSVDQALAVTGDMRKVHARLTTLHDLGLGYLTLGEPTPALSGGEAQRLKLASEMGRAQSHAVFVFDEPTIGLHPLDVRVLLGVFDRLVASGATVLVIEHDLDVSANADWVIDMGPGGGESGGRIVAAGTPEQIAADANSVTGRYLR